MRRREGEPEAQVPLLAVEAEAPPSPPAWPRWADPEGAPPHTDRFARALPAAAFALPWAPLANLRDPDGFAGFAMVRRALLLALRRLTRRPRRDVPQRFTVFLDFCGHEAEWLVAGLDPTTPALTALVAEHLDFGDGGLAGAAALDRVGRDGLQPVWRLDQGQIIEYVPGAQAGVAVLDGAAGLRTGLWLHRRAAQQGAPVTSLGALLPPG